MKTLINSILILSPLMKNPKRINHQDVVKKMKEGTIIADFSYNHMDGNFIIIDAMLIT